MRRLIYISVMAALTFGCSNEKKGGGDDNESVATESKEDDATGSANDETTGGGEDPLFQLGMPDHCSLVTKDDQGCFQCQPRDLPLEQCITLPSSFDAAADCQHDLDKMSCEVANFEWDFNDRSKVESMYERLPVIFTIVKALVAQKFSDKPETIQHIGMILDHLSKYRLDLFTGQNLDKIASEGVDIIKKIRPDLEIDKDQAEQTLAKMLAVLDQKRKEGDIQDADMLAVLANMFGQLPDGVGDIVAGLQDGNLDALGNFDLPGDDDGEDDNGATTGEGGDDTSGNDDESDEGETEI